MECNIALLHCYRELLWTLDSRELRKLETILCKNHSPSTPEMGDRFDYTTGGRQDDDKLTSSGNTSAGPGIVPLCDQSLYCAYLHMISSEGVDAEATTRAVPIGIEVRNAVVNDEQGSPDGAAESPVKTQASSTGSSMHHQDSVDSGLLSGSVTSLSWQRSNVVNARCLRHSLSWPEIRKQRTCPRELNTGGRTSILGGFDIDSGSSIGAAMHCPLGGSISVMETTEYRHPMSVDLSDIVPCRQTHSPADNVDSDDGHQVSYVTPTLSDVFLTDDTFQGATNSADNDTRDDVAMETTRALATASGSNCDGNAANLVHKHTHPSSSDTTSSTGSVVPSSPMSSTKHSLGTRRAHKAKRPAIRVTLSHDGCQSTKGRKSSETLSWELDRWVIGDRRFVVSRLTPKWLSQAEERTNRTLNEVLVVTWFITSACWYMWIVLL